MAFNTASLVMWQQYINKRVQHKLRDIRIPNIWPHEVNVNTEQDMINHEVRVYISFTSGEYKQTKKIAVVVPQSGMIEYKFDKTLEDNIEALPAWFILNLRAAEAHAKSREHADT